MMMSTPILMLNDNYSSEYVYKNRLLPVVFKDSGCFREFQVSGLLYFYSSAGKMMPASVLACVCTSLTAR